MAQARKLSLLSAILININIMLGSGIFINTALLAKQAGSLGAAVYLIVGLLLLPLILAIAELLRCHQGESTFYHFGLSISPFFGFISSWSYFIGKLCSCSLGIHVCISFLQQIIPSLQVLPTLLLDMFIILLFTLLNLLKLQTGKSIQYSFIVLKVVPIIFAIIAGFYLLSGTYFTHSTLLWSGVPLSIPLVIYAFSGFEASCSLSNYLENPKKNGPKAILLSYGIVVATVILYQFLFFSSLGPALGSLTNGYLGAFPALISQLPINGENSKNILVTLLHIGIASSSLGASYGILYSNSWNLYTLAHYNHTFGKKLLTTFNSYSVPYACVIIEGIIVASYLLITKGHQIPLQQVASLGSTIAYTFSSVALFVLTYRKQKLLKLVPILSLISCLLLMGSFIWSIAVKGVSPLLLLFLAMLALGSWMFFKKHNQPSSMDVFEKL
jgi:amino acid transporter